jgi:hypothetical protein
VPDYWKEETAAKRQAETRELAWQCLATVNQISDDEVAALRQVVLDCGDDPLGAVLQAATAILLFARKGYLTVKDAA